MNEIEKMYENAGVKFIIGVRCRAKIGDGCKSRCPDCDYNTKPKEYPPFTAEKQLLLLQCLLDKTDLYLHRHKTDFTYSIISGNFAVNKYKDFKESIAEFINTIWQDLTEDEKQQIKEILE